MLFSRWRVHMYKECLWTYIFFPFIFLIYMATPTLLVWEDTIASRYLPISLIREANFDLNEFDFPYDKEIPYFLQYRNGRLISSYPVGAVLTAHTFLFSTCTARNQPSIVLDTSSRKAVCSLHCRFLCALSISC